MSEKLSAAERAEAIADAIGRFERGVTTGKHDGRPVAVNLGIEAGFGGSDASRRQQVQQYLSKFPELRRRWKQAVDDAQARAGAGRVDLRAELAAEKRRAAALEQQLNAMVRVADLLRRKAERLERQLTRQRARDDPHARPDVRVVPFGPRTTRETHDR